MDPRNRLKRPLTVGVIGGMMQAIGRQGQDRVGSTPTTRVQESPLNQFLGDQIFTGAGQFTVTLPNYCTGARFASVAGTPLVNINSGGDRLVFDQDVISGAEIWSMTLNMIAGDSVRVQVFGMQAIPQIEE